MTQPTTSRQEFTLDSGDKLTVATTAAADKIHITMISTAKAPLVLHWGLAWQYRYEWRLPGEAFRPAGTTVVNGQAAQTPFGEKDGVTSLELKYPKPTGEPGPRGLKFVLYQPESQAWLKKRGGDLYLPLFKPAPDHRVSSPELADMAERIVGAEKGASSWTLMHRFQLCHELLDEARDEDGLALLYAWLRYSAIRQLDWQRRYNTKPRELSHAQERLTARITGLWRQAAGNDGRSLWLRLLLTTLGRGGDGQRVRDEILHIMHRNHLKEAHGTFIEEWHQKLHNNTTPDDIVICDAYLAYLRSGGNKNRFYETLRQGGVPRARLTSFERPICSDPEFYPDKKDVLIGEFESFLRILRSVHAGTDLDTAFAAARGRLNADVQGRLYVLLALRQRSPEVRDLAGALTAVREGIRTALQGASDDAAARDLLFLDLALEESFRGTVERQNISQLDRDRLVDLVHLALQNVRLSTGAREAAYCAAQWSRLSSQGRDGRDWALHASSVADRAARWIQNFTSAFYQRLQPKAELLGSAFAVEAWTVPLFSEEVIRGGPAFVLALLLRHVDPLLRRAAGMGGWQVISPGRATGQIRAIGCLKDVQGQRFAQATVLLATGVEGDEEIPEGVTAVITRDSPDVVAHVAVRARNASVLLASCLETETYQALQGLQDKTIEFHVTPAGDVVFAEAAEADDFVCASSREARKPEVRLQTVRLRLDVPPGPWAIPQEKFAPGAVGSKSNNLNHLRGRLPQWIGLPASIALPFGAFERVLGDCANRETRRQAEAHLATVGSNPGEVLRRLRDLLQGMIIPDALRQALGEVWQRAGLPAVTEEWLWHAVRSVWASQWNERAYLSRRAHCGGHENLRMAVLIQQVVPADYAYVIHTVNPLTGNRDELFAEVVLGLGETLVGNYPGRALGFTCKKTDRAINIVSYPSKSVGLYGSGVIFRSDSNGEDLEGFAGAGLYDSYLAEEPLPRELDYSQERLVWDRGWRDDLLRKIAGIGLEIERLLGSPQDIEGAVAGGQFYVVQARPQVGLKP
jgi:alpha-glucan,water dikinase